MQADSQKLQILPSIAQELSLLVQARRLPLRPRIYLDMHQPARRLSYPQIIKFLRWKAAALTMVWIGDDLYCPLLLLDPETELSRILRPASYPLDSAVTIIHEHRGLRKSLPCEASRVLTVYDELHRLDFSDANITLLDPKLFDFKSLSYGEENVSQATGRLDRVHRPGSRDTGCILWNMAPQNDSG